MLCRNPCACHPKSSLNFKKWSETLVLNDFDHQITLASQPWYKFLRSVTSMVWAFQILTILTSEPLSRHSVEQIFRILTSKRGPDMQRGAFFWSKPLCRHSVVQNLATSSATNPPHPSAFRSWLSEPGKPQNYGKHSVLMRFAQFLPAKTSSSHTSQLYQICAITSLGWQIFRGNSQYSRKLDP